ncbi:DUF1499 domain-containing protein [uncultured Desulfobulbus sp.]|uniref:DUF1499 domain-containing protein n=1 Tax=uncultured Desulfobulbus sp. TaxID=239745 RepID=UPI0029C7459C|nr:DUF1499 domain-containing protein [uncultured Desulfobulbus sp.]
MKNRTHWLPKVQFFWLVIALAAVFGFRVSLLPWRPAIMMVATAVGGLVLTGFFSLLVLFVLLRAGRRGGGKNCLFSAALSLPALISVLLLGVQGAKAPLIHDITTDTDNPPVFRAAQTLRQAEDNSIDYPGKTVADRQQHAYPDIKPIETPLLPAETFAQSLATAEKLRWRVIGQEREQGLIEAVDQTLIFGFTDDIIIRIAPTGNGSRIDLRSASRAGISDLGVNADRIRAFRRTFNSIRSKE